MAEFRVNIFRTEYFRGAVVVKASSAEEARKKVEQEWQDSERLYEIITDCPWDSETQFDTAYPATERDIKECIYIK